MELRILRPADLQEMYERWQVEDCDMGRRYPDKGFAQIVVKKQGEFILEWLSQFETSRYGTMEDGTGSLDIPPREFQNLKKSIAEIGEKCL